MSDNKEEILEHEHEHEHDHEHEHEHEHKHEHEHHHEHEHVHVHGHDHDHDHHDHEHEETHTYEVEGYELVETHMHEGATICSFERDIRMSGDEARAAAEEAYLALRDWLNEQGAIIGHVKGYIKDNGITTTFSTVGGDLHVNANEGTGSRVGFASIVFGPDEETLKDKVIEEFARLK